MRPEEAKVMRWGTGHRKGCGRERRPKQARGEMAPGDRARCFGMKEAPFSLPLPPRPLLASFPVCAGLLCSL